MDSRLRVRLLRRGGKEGVLAIRGCSTARVQPGKRTDRRDFPNDGKSRSGASDSRRHRPARPCGPVLSRARRRRGGVGHRDTSRRLGSPRARERLSCPVPEERPGSSRRAEGGPGPAPRLRSGPVPSPTARPALRRPPAHGRQHQAIRLSKSKKPGSRFWSRCGSIRISEPDRKEPSARARLVQPLRLPTALPVRRKRPGQPQPERVAPLRNGCRNPAWGFRVEANRTAGSSAGRPGCRVTSRATAHGWAPGSPGPTSRPRTAS